jgi:hypothetical protein
LAAVIVPVGTLSIDVTVPAAASISLMLNPASLTGVSSWSSNVAGKGVPVH